ncbi:hypothetical protein [Pseudonocardia sp. T1-2H]|uniref:hypothetical protein n=1 Tax=Pseudonocardia sp. T1-2H TaxID=3128899 RepID=UPI00310136FC
MAIEFRILVVDTSAPPAAPELSLQSLRDAVLAHPLLALQALRHALDATAEVEGPTAGGHSGPLPLDTPIFKMLSPDQAKLLSPAAMKLTKADLLALQEPGGKAKMAELNITFDDLKTVEEAFHQSFDVSGLQTVESDGDACCCCTPCCCCTAAAVPEPMIRAA